MGTGKGSLLVHIGSNRADKEGKTAIVKKYRCHGLRVYPVCVCNRSGYLANQHTSSEGQGSRDLRQTRVEPY